MPIYTFQLTSQLVRPVQEALTHTDYSIMRFGIILLSLIIGGVSRMMRSKTPSTVAVQESPLEGLKQLRMQIAPIREIYSAIRAYVEEGAILDQFATEEEAYYLSALIKNYNSKYTYISNAIFNYEKRSSTDNITTKLRKLDNTLVRGMHLLNTCLQLSGRARVSEEVRAFIVSAEVEAAIKDTIAAIDRQLDLVATALKRLERMR